MPWFVDELQGEAQAAIAAMQQAALTARDQHARAELMRHMLTTARKVKHKPEAEAVEGVVREWMDAWNLPRSEWPHLEQNMNAFTAAFYTFANAPGAEADGALRKACAELESGFERAGMRLCDEMAWRSQCAHGWWALVAPQPAALAGAKSRPGIPSLQAGQRFWEPGCADFCR